MPLSSLPAIPGSPFRALDYTANEGQWLGGLDEVRWGYEKGWLRSQVRRALIRRRWFQVFFSNDAITVTAWIRDEGLDGCARVLVTDRNSGEVLAQRSGTGRPLSTMEVCPYSGRGANAWIRTDDCEMALSRPENAPGWTLVARWEDVVIDVHLVGPGATTVIGEHADRRPGLTTKWNTLAASGSVRVGERAFELDGLGAITYTNGFFPEDARWFEVTGVGEIDGRRVGLAISDGNRHGAVQEHALWIDDAIYGTSRVRILVGGRVSRDTWRLRSPDGDLELKFRPRAADVETADRVYGSSRTERVVGVFQGRIPLPDGGELRVLDLPGIAEDHRPL